MKAMLNGTFSSDSQAMITYLLLWNFRVVWCGVLWLDISLLGSVLTICTPVVILLSSEADIFGYIPKNTFEFVA
jgi:hypothetical protein